MRAPLIILMPISGAWAAAALGPNNDGAFAGFCIGLLVAIFLVVEH